MVKWGGGEKTGKKIRRAAAAVCEMLEQRQLLDADSYTYLGAPSVTVQEGDMCHAAINCMNISPGTHITATWGVDIPGTACPDDYDDASGEVLLTGDGSYTDSVGIEFPILRDNIVEGDETFTLWLTSVSEGHMGWPQPPGSRTHIHFTITDDPPIVDVAPYSDGSETIDPLTGDPHPICVTVTRSGGDISEPLDVTLQRRGDSTAYPSDFSIPQVHLEGGQSSKIVDLPVSDDSIVEWKESAIILAVTNGTHIGRNVATTYIRDDDAGLLYQDLDEEDEDTPNEIDPGGYVALNCDDDYGNGILDYLEGQQGTGAASDDELQPLSVVLPQDPPSQYASVTFSTTGGGLRLWRDDLKTQPLDSSYLWGSSVPQTIWVEGMAAGTSTVTMEVNELIYANGHYYWDETALTDSVNINTMVLPAPEDFATTLGDARDQVKLTWIAPQAGESGFELDWREYGETDWNDLCTVGNVETASHNLPSDYAGKTYEYRIVSTEEDHGIAIMSLPVTTTGSRIALQGVGFTGSLVQTIRRDFTQGQSEYAWPEWWDENCDGEIAGESSAYTNHTIDIYGELEHRYPVSYLRSTSAADSFMSLRAWTQYQGTWDSGWLVRACGADKVFAESGVSGSSDPQISVSATTPLSNVIDKQYATFDWEMSTDNGSTWFYLGENQNEIYVTGAPASGAFETVLDLCCDGAKGLNPDTQQTSVVSGIWGKFSSGSGPANVHRVDGTALTYYGSVNTQSINTASLLGSGDGQCGAWALFFADTLKCSGVTGVHYVTVRPGIVGATGFLIGNWVFSGNGTSGDSAFPYLQTEVTYSTNHIPGQNNDDPLAMFENHQVLRISETYYDPSYGKTYSTLQQMDAAVIGGFWKVSGATIFYAKSLDQPDDIIADTPSLLF